MTGVAGERDSQQIWRSEFLPANAHLSSTAAAYSAADVDNLVLEKPLEPSTRKVVTRSPARTVRIINLRGVLPAPIEAESSLERDFILRAALNPFVTAIVHQPFRLRLERERTYTPDFLVTLTTGERVVVEVKPLSKVEKYKPLLDDAAAHLRARGHEFMVADDTAIRRERAHARAALILRYAKTAFGQADCDRAVRAVSQKPHGIPIGTLRKQARVARETVFHLIALRQLSTGRRLMLDDAAIVFVPAQQEIHDADKFASWFDAALWPENA